MNLNNFVVSQILKQFRIPESSLKHLALASQLSNVNGRGFPKELLLLSVPMVSRGLLNYAILQMKRDWVYPYWVHQQLDATGSSFIPRSQNPLMMNITHRNWTGIGSPRGLYEAIVDPRGLVTPLPREWSVDTWFTVDGKEFFPSQANAPEQTFDAEAPSVRTRFIDSRYQFVNDSFVASTRKKIDVVFQRSTVQNISKTTLKGILWFAVRPFSPEGIAPIESIEIRNRFVNVNDTVGLVLAKEPDLVCFGNSDIGDSARSIGGRCDSKITMHRFRCQSGLANVSLGYRFVLEPGEQASEDFSIALQTEKILRARPVKQTWRVSFESRLKAHRSQWSKELNQGARFVLPDSQLQQLFEASRSTLLQFHDGDFISPGPFLYHHFWFRDSALMLRALDVLGFTDRSKEVIDVFYKRQMADGFYKGPDGEWDSNGAVLWTVYQHHLLAPSVLWLRRLYPSLRKGALWIINVRKKRTKGRDVRGLMPQSLSAEHLGTVDQYYWDTFWSLAGIQCIRKIASELGKDSDVSLFAEEERAFVKDVESSLTEVAQRNSGLIPASPHRRFDEGAIGSVCASYPLKLFTSDLRIRQTVRTLIDRYCTERGYLHSIVHSGYNPYMTLQLAHACLLAGEINCAWVLADSIFKNALPPFSFPEAIHPHTGGGSMGDGHHGWVAAEIVLFLLETLVAEREDCLILFEGAGHRLVIAGETTRLERVPTRFGYLTVTLRFEPGEKGVLEFHNKFLFDRSPSSLIVHLPFRIKKLTPVSVHHVQKMEQHNSSSILSLSPGVTTIFFEVSN